MELPSKITKKVVAKTFIIIYDDKKLSTNIAEQSIKEKLIDDIEAYNKKPSKAKFDKIVKVFNQRKEAKLVAVKAEKKAVKSKLKEIKQLKAQESVEAKQKVKKKIVKTTEVIKTLDNDKRFIATGTGELQLKGYPVDIPKELVAELQAYYTHGQPLEPLINFWMLAMLNPNPQARTKMFRYLSKHKLIVTPNGYFVTYRMVKKTNQPNVYTHAHNNGGKNQLYYYPGKVARILRSECDEDGSKDCSRGLHTGTPDFIGIQLGQGYEPKILTKEQGGGQGTGYGQNINTNQEFDKQFGNQAIICLVNPMHVVSVPDSDTRKMRSCEFYFCKTTTPEEVIKLQSVNDYSIFDNEYKEFEKEELERMLKETKLSNYKKSTPKTDSQLNKLIEQETELREKLKTNFDAANKSLSIAEIKQLISNRVKLLK